MATIYAYSPSTETVAGQFTGDGFYYTDPDPVALFAQVGFVKVAGLTLPSGEDVYRRPSGAAPAQYVLNGIAASIGRVVPGQPWTRSVWTKTEVVEWNQLHPGAVGYAVFRA